MFRYQTAGITVQQFLSDHGLISSLPSLSSPICGSQSLPPLTTPTRQSQFLFSPCNPKGSTSFPIYRAGKMDEEEMRDSPTYILAD